MNRISHLYPALSDRLPYVSLGEFPTPVQRLERLGGSLGVSRLFIKRDDVSGAAYGGNKVRKLEFLLGEALRQEAKEVLTFGFAGSNHCLATAFYAKRLGMRSISMLMPQPNAVYVRQNLLMSHAQDAELHLCANLRLLKVATVWQMARHRMRQGRLPKVIPPGGSSPLGVIGFVEGAFELREQIANGELPEPDRIYVAAGTMGTAGGLALGLRAAGLRTRVEAIAVADTKFVNARAMLKIIRRTNDLLTSLDPSFPDCGFTEGDIHVNGAFVGANYGAATPEGAEAIALMERLEGVKLEGTYTAKALAALINDVRQQGDTGPILFWNTYNSRDFSSDITSVDYRALPKAFYEYFEEDIQRAGGGSAESDSSPRQD